MSELESSSDMDTIPAPLKSPSSKCGVKCFCDAKMKGKFSGQLCCGHSFESNNDSAVHKDSNGAEEVPTQPENHSQNLAIESNESGDLVKNDESMEFSQTDNSAFNDQLSSASNYGSVNSDEDKVCEDSNLNDTSIKSDDAETLENKNKEDDEEEEFDVCPLSPLHTDNEESLQSITNDTSNDTSTALDSLPIEETESQDNSINNVGEFEKETSDKQISYDNTNKEQISYDNTNKEQISYDNTNKEDTEEKTNMDKSDSGKSELQTSNEMTVSKADNSVDVDVDEAGDVSVKKEPLDYEEHDFETLRDDAVGDEMAKIDDFEICEDAAPKRKRPRKATPRKIGQTNQKQYLPFEKGWKREVVIRNPPSEGKDGKSPLKRAADVYYRPPKGKKLRSLPEVEAFLKLHPDCGLDIKCFTFTKNPIYEEPFEIVRQAGASNFKRASLETPMKVKTPKLPKAKKDTQSPSHSELPGFGPVSARKRLGPKLSLKPKKFKAAAGAVEKAKAFLSAVSNGQTESTRMSPPAQMQICGLKCPGLANVAPSLPCGVCMCLFHHQCVNFDVNSKQNMFVCLRCIKVCGESGFSGIIADPTYRKSKASIDEAVRSVTSVIDNESSGMSDLKISNVTGNAANSAMSTVTRPMPPLHKAPTASYQGAMPTIIRAPPLLTGPGSATSSNSATTVATTVTPGPPQLQAAPTTVVQPSHLTHMLSKPPLQPAPAFYSMNPSIPPALKPKPGNLQYKISPAPSGMKGQLLSLPDSVVNKLNMNQPLALRINNQSLLVQPSAFIKTAQGLKILLPLGTLKDTSPKMFASVVSSPKQLESGTAKNGDSTSKPVTVVLQTPQEKTLRPRKLKSISVCHIQRLHVGFDSLLDIFKYLRTKDRLIASQVCRTWRNLATQHVLCKSIFLKGVTVTDWSVAAAYFTKYGTECLDMRGMCHREDTNRTWHQLTGVLSRFHTLKCINFGRCPAIILHAVAENVHHLKELSAEWVTDVNTEPEMWTTITKLDIGKLSQLIELEDLKLRGVCGLVLPAFSFSGGLTELSSLTNLKKLSLTTLHEVPDSEFGFLSSLTGLELLELGDCSLMTSETYEILGLLTELKMLRLECGGLTPNTGLTSALGKLSKLERLELVMFKLDKELIDMMTAMKSLKFLLVLTDVNGKPGLSNNLLLQGVQKMDFLEHFEWGVMPPGASEFNAEFIPFIAQLKQETSVPDPENADKSIIPATEETIEYMSIDGLGQKLLVHLPNTRIRVYKVPGITVGEENQIKPKMHDDELL